MTKKIDKPDQCGDTTAHLGILLMNLGTPDASDPAAVRRYLAEFLWDPRVIEFPRLLWWFILHGVILRIRPKRSARAYQRVWTEEGSPLLAISKRQVTALQTALTEKLSLPVTVALGMRYGNPSIESGLETLRRAHARHILVLPLYPQYSATTTASCFDKVSEVLRDWRYLPELRLINQYADHPAYITALTSSIETYWQQHGRAEHLLFSFHGIPKRYFLAGDPYYYFCHKTASLVAENLGLAEQEWSLVFQSRFGREEWLQPYCDDVLRDLAQQGIKKVEVVCPGFAADCLETLDEIAVEYNHLFQQAGGEELRYIPALNDVPMHIDMLTQLVQEHTQGWGGRNF